MANATAYLPFNLRATVDSIMASLVPLALSKNCRLDLVWDGRLPLEVSGDSARLRRTVIGLMNEALAVTANGSVRLVVSVVAGRESGHRLMFEIQDSSAAWNFQITADFEPAVPMREVEFDAEVLHRLSDHSSNGEPLDRVLAADYLRDSGAILSGLTAALKERRWLEVRDHAQTLRAASLTLGLCALAKQCETCANQPQAADAEAVSAAWLRACDFLRNYVATPGHQVA